MGSGSRGSSRTASSAKDQLTNTWKLRSWKFAPWRNFQIRIMMRFSLVTRVLQLPRTPKVATINHKEQVSRTCTAV